MRYNVCDMTDSGTLPPICLPGEREVPEWALHERASTSGGPGGQHANKTSTRIDLRVHVASLPVTEVERARLLERLASRMTADGTIGVSVADHRSQLRNRIDARRRLERVLIDALAVQAPRVKKRPTRGMRDRWRAARMRDQSRRRDRSWKPGDDD